MQVKGSSKAGRKGTRPAAVNKKNKSASNIRDSILKALSHSEAEDGLYFRNFFLLHEEDKRPSVAASKEDLLSALNQLLEEGRIRVDHDDLEVTFRLAASR